MKTPKRRFHAFPTGLMAFIEAKQDGPTGMLKRLIASAEAYETDPEYVAWIEKYYPDDAVGLVNIDKGHPASIIKECKRALALIDDGDTDAALMAVYLIGESVGRLNHSDLWFRYIRYTGSQTSIGSSSKYDDHQIERAKAVARRLKQIGVADRNLVTQTTNQLDCEPDRKTITGWLRDAGILPKKPKKKNKRE